MKIDLTIEEANALANLLDIAVKAGGIPSARSALHFIDKLEQAATKEQHPQKEDE